MDHEIHSPVLLKQVIDVLHPNEHDSYLDLTAGYGGHAQAVANRLSTEATLTLIDRDSAAVEYLKNRFQNDQRVEVRQADFVTASTQLIKEAKRFDCILADIGVSSPHLDNPDRGFSFMNDGPLDMRMDNRQAQTAADIVNSSSKDELANILYRYGELKSSRKIADRIIQHRPIQTTTELTAIIPTTAKNKMRVLAQVFQALRIATNDELNQLETALPLWQALLKPGGRLAVISFHSLEDRIVKKFFAEHGADVYGSEFKVITKRPLIADSDEIVINPRARSAKLRGVQRK